MKLGFYTNMRNCYCLVSKFVLLKFEITFLILKPQIKASETIRHSS